MTSHDVEEVVPIIILTAAATFAASTIIRSWMPHVQPQRRTTRKREQMRQIKELRKIKEEFQKAQAAEDTKSTSHSEASDLIEESKSSRPNSPCEKD